MDESTANDLDLLRRYAADRDADAFAAITGRYAAMVYTVARRVTGSAHDAEDIAQACFLELARRAGEVRTSLAGWLHALVVSRSRNFLRDGAVRARHERGAMAELPARIDLPPRSNDSAEWDELSPLIDQAIDALPEDLRLPLVLHYLHDRGQGEIAVELALSQSTVSRRIKEGIERLRAQLRQAGLSASVAGIVQALPYASARNQPVPTTLKASLGKLAIAGIGAPAAAAGAGKWIAVAAGLLVVLGGGMYVLMNRGPTVAANPSAKIVTDGGRTYIAQVPALVWGAGNSGQRSMLGALAAASRATDRPIDYTRLLGDSSLAFLVRWEPIADRDVNAYRAVSALDEEPFGAVEQAIGFRLKRLGKFGRDRTPVQPWVREIESNLAAGWPVIAEERADRDMAVIVGRVRGAGRLIVNEYNAPGGSTECEPDELGGGLMVFDGALSQPERKAAFKRAITRALDWWDRGATSTDGMAYGPAAFDAWIADTLHGGRGSEASEWALWRESWWTYDLLCDGHAHAARYLKQNADLLGPRARPELLAAAEEYASLASLGLADSVYEKSTGPWTQKTIDDFRSTRQQQAAIFREVKGVTTRAIEHLRNALRAAE